MWFQEEYEKEAKAESIRIDSEFVARELKQPSAASKLARPTSTEWPARLTVCTLNGSSYYESANHTVLTLESAKK